MEGRTVRRPAFCSYPRIQPSSPSNRACPGCPSIGDLTHDAYISLQSLDPPILESCPDRLVRAVVGLKLDIYQHLLSINAGYDQVIGSLAALRQYGAFQAGELARFSALSKETRAATNSYLVSVLETAETDDAGRRFRKRLAQQRSDEQGS